MSFITTSIVNILCSLRPFPFHYTVLPDRRIPHVSFSPSLPPPSPLASLITGSLMIFHSSLSLEVTKECDRCLVFLYHGPESNIYPP